MTSSPKQRALCIGAILHGEPLDPREVKKASELDIEYCKHMEVYEKVPTQQARERGHQTLGVKSVGARTCDWTNRSRLAASQIKTHDSPELFAATSPIQVSK